MSTGYSPERGLGAIFGGPSKTIMGKIPTPIVKRSTNTGEIVGYYVTKSGQMKPHYAGTHYPAVYKDYLREPTKWEQENKMVAPSISTITSAIPTVNQEAAVVAAAKEVSTAVSSIIEATPTIPVSQAVTAVVSNIASSDNPYSTFSEKQLSVEKANIDGAIAYRQSKGLAGGGYEDMSLITLYSNRALLMAAYTPILIKKYGLYTAGALAIFLTVKILLRRRKQI